MALWAVLGLSGCSLLRPSGPPPGMDAAGQVVDPWKVEPGHGTVVLAPDGLRGEITGLPEPGSRFMRLQIGMSMDEVVMLIGPPNDAGPYVTGRAWIPDALWHRPPRVEFLYKHQGRLVFVTDTVQARRGGRLVWIIHSARQGGYR